MADKYSAIESTTVRDQAHFWKHLIAKEAYLLELGYKELTIGAHNFELLFNRCLLNRAFRCLLVLITHFNNMENSKQIKLKIDLVNLICQALTIYSAPLSIIQ